MNFSLFTLEIAVVGLALLLLLLDLWTPQQSKGQLAYFGILGLAIILGASFVIDPVGPASAGEMLVQDGLALFFQRFFLIAAIFVLLISYQFAPRIMMGIGEFYVIVLVATAGMMLAASANDFVIVFVALELISVSFYVLVSFQRSRIPSLEAGVKYLIMSALSAAFLVFGIALIFGTANQTNFIRINSEAAALAHNKVFWLGLLLVMLGLGFKIAAFPMQVWAPDVYQGAPTPVTAFLAIGSKAAGFILLLRVLFVAAPALVAHWEKLLMLAAAFTILYGNLCAIPQRNLKRLLGYSSIANAGYMLLGISAMSAQGSAAVLYYLAGYLCTLAAVFVVLCVAAVDNDDISSLTGLSQRAPLLAAGMTIAMVSLAGIPPLAGFLGKFFLLKAIIDQGAVNPAYFWLAGVAIIGVVISIYYYFGVIRVMYWPLKMGDASPIFVPKSMKLPLFAAIAGMLYLGIFPNLILTSAMAAVRALKF